MKSRASLGQLLANFERRLNRLERIFLNVIRMPNPPAGAKSDLNYFTIELLNSYRAFNRAFLFSSCKGAKTLGGTTVYIQGVHSEFDFIATVFASYRNKSCDFASRTWNSRDEPPWEADVRQIASKLALQNLASVDNAFTVSAFYRDLKCFRNFCAHRSQSLFGTARDSALAYNVVGKSIEVLLTSKTPAGQYLPLIWIDSSRTYARTICQ